MSVLNLPRIFFRGTMYWDPIVSNNSPVFDAVNAQIRLPPGEDYNSFKEWMIKTDNGDWNYFGTHDCGFQSTIITGGMLPGGRDPSSDDILIGKEVSFPGRLVDLNAYNTSSSQIFPGDFSFGHAGSIGRGRPVQRLHSRWLTFTRNEGGLPIAGNASVVWQTCIKKEELALENTAGSLLLSELQIALQSTNVLGIMIRFNTYRTLYFQNGILNEIPQQPRTITQLKDLYKNGEVFSNPAYSALVGVIGLWEEDEDLISTPEGRYLTPTHGSLAGPAVAELFPEQDVLSIDLNSTIPELDEELEKRNLGALSVNVRDSQGGRTRISEIPYIQYSRNKYEESSGIVDIKLSEIGLSQPETLIHDGLLEITVEQNGETITIMSERELTVETNDRDIYLDQEESRSIDLFIKYRGKAAPAGTRVLVAEYDANRQLKSTLPDQAIMLEADDLGIAQLVVNATKPGFTSFEMFPFFAENSIPAIPGELNVRTGFICNVRTLPFDDELERTIHDDELSWEFIYQNILRVYDLIAPRMSAIMDLSNRSLMESMAQRVTEVTSKELFENPRYMPVTRDLSAGKRKLLHRWSALVTEGRVPENPSTPQTVSLLLNPFDDPRVAKNVGDK